jgi:hypothetical protein
MGEGERLAKLVAEPYWFWMAWSRSKIRLVRKKEGYVNLPSRPFFRELAAFNTGLCLITTRIPIADIADHERTSALSRDLKQLSSDAGAKLLRAVGVKGPKVELRSASDEFNGHPRANAAG